MGSLINLYPVKIKIAAKVANGILFKTVGIAYDWQKLNHDLWRPQDHDQPLDYILTNSSIYPKV
jgi:5-formyltetrahydrofolate cyclo-ligase